MPEVQNTPRQAYKATVELAFDMNGQRIPIESEKIVYIMIENNYESENLPNIYATISVNSEMYSNITKNKDTGRFYLHIEKENANSNCSLSKQTIEGDFTYIVSNTNPNYTEDLNDTSNDPTLADSSYKRIMIGLISIDLTNALRKSFNNVYNNIDQSTLVGLALEGTDVVIEKLKYNESYDSIIVPPITSRLQMLEFVFNKSAFYDTMFRYFMDFDRSYLLSKEGNAVDAGDGKLSSIIVDIRSVTEDESYYEGMEIKDGAYYLYVNPANTNVTLDQGTEKVANRIIAVDDNSDMQQLDLDINSTQGSDTKDLFIRSDNAALYKNELESNTAIIELVKQNIDGIIFTPNKCITINNYGDYAKYNGKYIMIYKKEFYKCTAGEFVVSSNVGLKKVGNIESAGSKSNSNTKKNLAANTSATKRSSASKRNSLKTVSVSATKKRV